MNEHQLIKLCLKNNRAAQHQLYQQFSQQMLGICYRYTKSLDDAEDVLQEGFVKVFTHLNQFKHDGPLGGWIRRIMVNCSISYLRKHNRYRTQMDFEKTPMHPVMENDAIIKINTQELVDLIRLLPAGYQTVFNLVAVEGYNHIEVAEILEISENTSRSQYSRARAVLIKWLNEKKDKEALKTNAL